MVDHNLDKTERQSFYESAREMMIQENTRWSSWSLLYLGIISATIVAIPHLVENENLKEVIPLWLVFLFDAFISFLWLYTILNIRSTTHSWTQTLLELEKSTDIKPFTLQDEIRKQFSFWKDLISNIGIKPQNGETEKKFLMFKSVTRVLTVLSIILVIGFTILFFRACYLSTKQTEKTPLIILGKKLIDRDLSRLYPGAKIIDVLGPVTNSKGESIIQLRIIKTTGEQSFVNWRIDQSGAAILNEEG